MENPATSSGLERYDVLETRYARPETILTFSSQDYDPDDIKGQGDSFVLDRALRAHRIDDEGQSRCEIPPL